MGDKTTGADTAPHETPVLELQDARISYFTRAGEVNVIPGISFKLYQGPCCNYFNFV